MKLPVVQEEMSFKDISCLELWQPFSSAERNHLSSFRRGYQEEQFCEIILNQEKMSFKRFLIWSASGPDVRWSKTVYAILVEVIMGNIQVCLFDALRPKSTAMVMAGQSVHLTTLFPRQA